MRVHITLLLMALMKVATAFVVPVFPSITLKRLKQSRVFVSESTNGGYRPQYDDRSIVKKKALYPQAGDIVRYYDLDGGREDGQVSVGKITFIQKQLNQENKWMFEIVELEDTGDGYYAEYSSRKRMSKKTMRPLEQVSPVAASFVRTESAYKVPRNLGTGLPTVRQEQYDVEGYEGPFAGDNRVDQEVLSADGELYNKLKVSLIRNAALAGVAGTLVADLIKGTEDAVIYFLGALAGVGYVFFLTLKTDTLASTESKLGSNVANLRFVMPLFVFVAVAFYNKSLGDANPVLGEGVFSTVTPEQFAAATIGFLTYRIPLFVSQIKDFLDEAGGDLLPGSAGVAMQLAKQDVEEQAGAALTDTADLIPVLLVSGPQAAGRSELVKRLLSESEDRLVKPKLVDQIEDGANFERYETKEEFLQVDPSGRYGLVKEGILNAAGEDSVVVVDADVELTKKLTRIPGLRLIGVWVGLDSVEKFETRLQEQLDTGELQIPEDETRESVLRYKTREIVRDIEYGITSGIFEFTILNDYPEESIKQLKTAADYCFK